ncbi:STAS domain-containing protein [Catellatospora coxensis]
MLRVWSRHGPAGTVLTVTGRLDATTAGTLARLLGERLRHDCRTAIIVDVGGLDSISVAGVGVLTLFHAAASRLGVPLRVLRPSSAVRAMIDASGSGMLAAAVRSAGPLRWRQARCRARRSLDQPVRTSRRRHSGGCHMPAR